MDVLVAAGAGGLEAGQMPGRAATARELPRLRLVAAVAGDALVRAGQREACPIVRKTDDGEAGRRDGVTGLTRRAQLSEMYIVMARRTCRRRRCEADALTAGAGYARPHCGRHRNRRPTWSVALRAGQFRVRTSEERSFVAVTERRHRERA